MYVSAMGSPESGFLGKGSASLRKPAGSVCRVIIHPGLGAFFTPFWLHYLQTTNCHLVCVDRICLLPAMVDNPDVSSRSRPALRPRKARSKTGCLCCRLRKKKCDEKRPTCSGCTKLELICMWPDPKEFAWRIRLGLTSQTSSRRAPTTTSSPTEQPSSPARSAGATTSPLVSPKPPSPSPPLSVFNLDNDSSSWNLLQLYTEKTASLFLSPPEDFCDPFLFDVIPMAFGDPLVMDAVLSMGGFPLTTNERIDSIESQRMHHYGKALKGLKLSLTSWNEKRSEDPLRLLLTTVFLCQYEVSVASRSLISPLPCCDASSSSTVPVVMHSRH